jgi:hypothetical protein
MQSKKTRRTWSDQDKEALIRQAASHQGPHKEFYDKMRISGAWFRDMRKKFLKAHPEIDLTVPVVKMASGWPADPEERKREALRRMAKRAANKSSGPKLKPKPKAASHGSVVLDPAVASALAVYRSLPKLEKVPWREARRLSNGQVWQITHGIATPNIIARVLSLNGDRQLTVRDQRLARIPDPISLIPNSASQPASLPVALDDVIQAFEVKQDHMREFIDQLKRMRSGSTRV